MQNIKDIKNGVYNVILTSPEQCKLIRGHQTRLFQLLQDHKFGIRIHWLVVDKSHLVRLWGMTLGDNVAFRPAWGRIGDIRTRLPTKTPYLTMTVTAPPVIESSIVSSPRMKDPVVLRSTVNHCNIAYAVYPVYGNLRNLINLRFLVPDLSAFEEIDSISADQVLKRLK